MQFKRLIKKIKCIPWRKEPGNEWSIGIFTGDSPLHMTAPAEIQNPVLTAQNVSDVPAAFAADPFMLKEKDTWYLFFEIFNKNTDRGEIGLAHSSDGFRWQYSQIVLKEDFHVSYPCVFGWDREYWMVLEALESQSVRLYYAKDFPMDWTFVTTLIKGNCADPSVFRFQDTWWLFTCTRPFGNDILRLYYADRLDGLWKEHPASPIVDGSNRKARPAGRVISWNNRLIRFAQDCSPYYGAGVCAFEITELSTTTYAEKKREENPVLKPGIDNWNRCGMHHIDPHPYFNNKWIACVDGWGIPSKPPSKTH